MNQIRYFLFFALTTFNIFLYAQKPLKNLKNVKVAELDLVANVTEVLPGQSIQIGLYVETEDGQFGQTRGMLKGKLKWSNFEVEVQGGKFVPPVGVNLDGPLDNLYISENHGEFINDQVLIDIRLKDDPSIRTGLTIPISYGFENEIAFYGRHGQDGSSGRNGTFNLSGNGKGTRGGRGGPGGKGPQVDVYVSTSKDFRGNTLLDVRATMNNSKDVYKTKVDPDGGKLLVYAIGGRGGSGGWGGSGDCSHDKCISTDGAMGGDGGDGGPGGSITFHISDEAMKYKGIMQGFTPGGAGGRAGNGGSGGSSCSCTGMSNTYTGGGARGQNGQPGYKGQDGSGVQFTKMTHQPN
ncbi:MAG: hypothetical protein MRY83_08435 [Flavobacteriales bacterium]|nr:hypothetical protein [Flavobacteriales bacterium]